LIVRTRCTSFIFNRPFIDQKSSLSFHLKLARVCNLRAIFYCVYQSSPLNLRVQSLVYYCSTLTLIFWQIVERILTSCMLKTRRTVSTSIKSLDVDNNTILWPVWLMMNTPTLLIVSRNGLLIFCENLFSFSLPLESMSLHESLPWYTDTL
jgi:hypothetical protein